MAGRLTFAALVALALAGCASGPYLDTGYPEHERWWAS